MSPLPDHALPVGTLLRNGDYKIRACLGQGGFGITYCAEDRTLQRSVAIKELFPDGCGRSGQDVTASGGWTTQLLDDFKRRFIEEGRILARLRHPGIVHVYGIFEENGTAYLAMEYVEGQTVEDYLASRGGRLPADDAVEIIRQSGEALAEVHAASLLHRDIKPSNLMRRQNGQIVLIDFGAARDFLPDKVHSQTVILTPGYAPLEQYSRQGKRGPFTDVYALAATLYRLLTGVRPVEAIDRASGKLLPSPREVHPTVPKAVSNGVTAGMALKAEERPQTVKAFLNLLSDAGRSPLPQPRPASPSPLLSRRDLVIMGGVGAVIAGGWGLSKMLPDEGFFSPPQNAQRGAICINPNDRAELVFIPAGEFLMGSNDYEDEKPQHRVYTTGM